MTHTRRFGFASSLAVAIALVFTVGASGAWGDSCTTTVCTYTLNNPNPALSGFTGPYATATITLTDSTHATVTFDSLKNGGYIYLLGDGGTADLNVNGAYTLGAVTETNSISGFTPTFSANAPGQVDGFGTFNLSLNNDGGFTDSATHIAFTLTKTSGSWADASSVLTANGDGAFVAVHAFACAEGTSGSGCTTSTGAAATGFAANGGAVNTPEPTTISLLASLGVLMAAVVGFRRRIIPGQTV